MKASEGSHCTRCGEWYSAGTPIKVAGWELAGEGYRNIYEHDMPHPCAYRACVCGRPMYEYDLGFYRHVDGASQAGPLFCRFEHCDGDGGDVFDHDGYGLPGLTHTQEVPCRKCGGWHPSPDERAKAERAAYRAAHPGALRRAWRWMRGVA